MFALNQIDLATSRVPLILSYLVSMHMASLLWIAFDSCNMFLR